MRALAVATAVAISLASPSAWGHTFPPVRHVVAQVERCELVLLVGFRPGSGEPTEAILARAAGAPKSRALDTLRDVLGTAAMAPLGVSVDGKRLAPSSVRARVGVEPGGARPMVVLLVTYALPAGGSLAISTKDPRATRISWHDRDSGRVVISAAPAQGRWHTGVASFLLSLVPPSGGPACATTRSSPSDSSLRPAR
jgi:hypothetical protein